MNKPELVHLYDSNGLGRRRYSCAVCMSKMSKYTKKEGKVEQRNAGAPHPGNPPKKKKLVEPLDAYSGDCRGGEPAYGKQGKGSKRPPRQDASL